MTMPFLDTNVLLRHLRQDHPVFSLKASAIIQRIEDGELAVRTADTVIFETVFSLQRGYKQPRDHIAAGVLPLIELPGIVLAGKRIYRKVFALYTSRPLGFADCFHVALMERWKLTDVLSFDTDFDGLRGISRRDS
jgi:predicted nucleic acid-binding protein